MNDEQKVVAAVDQAAVQAALIARIRRARGARADAETRRHRDAEADRGEGTPSPRRIVGHGVAVDVAGLVERKDADLGDVESAVDHLRRVFEKFQRGTGYLPGALRGLVNEFEGDFVVKLKSVRGRLQEARKAAEG